MTYAQRKKIMPNSHESATEMPFEEDSCSVGESASNIDYGEVRLVAWEPYQDEPLARPRPRRENGEEKEQDPGALSIVRLESRYEKIIPIAQWEAKYMLT